MNSKRGIFLATACLLAVAAQVQAEEAKPTTAVDVGIANKYVWRGFELSDDSIVVQPGITVGYEGFSANLWGNFDTDNDAYDGAKWNETDITLSYTKDLGMATVGGGYIYYGLDGVDDSQELFVTASLNTILTPTLTIYREIAYAPAWIALLGLSQDIELGKNMSLTLGASASYYYSDDDGISEVNDPTSQYRALHNGLISATLNIPINDYITVKPNIAYSFPLSSEAEDFIEAASISDESQFVYGGVTLSIAY
ncbi:MAG: hypothetical protein LBU39_11380 [Desulfobulbaceae bacterium]|nr:hypothetical protein [Desulfobulbaceae bacterium]